MYQIECVFNHSQAAILHRYIGISALLVQIIDSKTGICTNGDGVTLFSCIGSSVVIKCAINNIKSDPVWSRNGNPIFTNGDRLHAAKNNKSNLQISDLVKSDTAKYCCLAITDRHLSEEYCTSLEIIGKCMNRKSFAYLINGKMLISYTEKDQN